MNKIHKKRFFFIILWFLGISIALGMILYALQQNINVFMTPSEVKTSALSSNFRLRLGGVVKPSSVKQHAQSLEVEFIVTDFKREIPVRYTGVLPDLFREGKGVIAEGTLTAHGIFNASTVLAKHDENYMPKEVYAKIRQERSS